MAHLILWILEVLNLSRRDERQLVGTLGIVVGLLTIRFCYKLTALLLDLELLFGGSECFVWRLEKLTFMILQSVNYLIVLFVLFIKLDLFPEGGNLLEEHAFHLIVSFMFFFKDFTHC
jgi:hypothetical protein